MKVLDANGNGALLSVQVNWHGLQAYIQHYAILTKDYWSANAQIVNPIIATILTIILVLMIAKIMSRPEKPKKNKYKKNRQWLMLLKSKGKTMIQRLLSFYEVKRVAGRLMKQHIEKRVAQKKIPQDIADGLLEDIAKQFGDWSIFPRKKKAAPPPAEDVKKAILARGVKRKKRGGNVSPISDEVSV